MARDAPANQRLSVEQPNSGVQKARYDNERHQDRRHAPKAAPFARIFCRLWILEREWADGKFEKDNCCKIAIFTNYQRARTTVSGGPIGKFGNRPLGPTN